MVVGSTGSILANAGLVKKIYLPREIFPLASMGGAGFMFWCSASLIAAAAIFSALPANPLDMLWFFPSVALIFVYGLAIGLFLSAVNVYLRDVQYLLDLVVMLAMWASPIVYSCRWSQARLRASTSPRGSSTSTRTTRSRSVSSVSHRASGLGAPPRINHPISGCVCSSRSSSESCSSSSPIECSSACRATSRRRCDGRRQQTGSVVVRVEDVSKTFNVRKDNTLKDRVVHLGRLGREHRERFTAVDHVSLDIQAGTTVGLLGSQRFPARARCSS